MRGQILKGNDGDGVCLCIFGDSIEVAERIGFGGEEFGGAGGEIADVAGGNVAPCIHAKFEKREQLARFGDGYAYQHRFTVGKKLRFSYGDNGLRCAERL